MSQGRRCLPWSTAQNACALIVIVMALVLRHGDLHAILEPHARYTS